MRAVALCAIVTMFACTQGSGAVAFGSVPFATATSTACDGRFDAYSAPDPFPRGESHHFVITGENNKPRRWRVRAPTYQNLQGVPAMIRDQQIADMTISLGSIDPCFSCTDRLETIDVRSGAVKIWKQDELLKLARAGKASR